MNKEYKIRNKKVDFRSTFLIVKFVKIFIAHSFNRGWKRFKCKTSINLAPLRALRETKPSCLRVKKTFAPLHPCVLCAKPNLCAFVSKKPLRLCTLACFARNQTFVPSCQKNLCALAPLRALRETKPSCFKNPTSYKIRLTPSFNNNTPGVFPFSKLPYLSSICNALAPFIVAHCSKFSIGINGKCFFNTLISL